MSTANAAYIAGASLPDLVITCHDSAGDPVDLSSGFATFSVKIGDGRTRALLKSTGITGTTTGATVSWASTAEISSIAAGTYWLVLAATTAGSKVRKFRGSLIIELDVA